MIDIMSACVSMPESAKSKTCNMDSFVIKAVLAGEIVESTVLDVATLRCVDFLSHIEKGGIASQRLRAFDAGKSFEFIKQAIKTGSMTAKKKGAIL